MRFNKIYLNNSKCIIPDNCSVISVCVDGDDVFDYTIIDNTIAFDMEFSQTIVFLDSEKSNIIGHSSKNSVFTYYSQDEKIVDRNCRYSIDIQPINQQVVFDTGFDPMYCKPKDVEHLINPIINLLNPRPDIEYEIFVTSSEVLSEYFDEDTDWEDVNMKNLSKLVSYKIAYNLVYNYYYQTVDKAGKFEERIGTLSESVSKYEINLERLLKRFEEEIDRLDELFGGKVFAMSFVKAKNSSTGLDPRLWDSGE